MKKLISLIVACALLAACTSNDEAIVASGESATAQSVVRSKSEAIDLALALMDGRSGSRSAYSVADVDIIGGESSRADDDTLIYAVNLADDKGFVLVSAAKAGEDILGYADNGTVNADDIDPNSGFAFYMDAAKDYVRELLGNRDSLQIITPGPGSGLIPNPSKPVTTYEKVPPRVTVKWGQHYPEGALFYNHISGCAQTATMQILSVFKQPLSISYTYPGHDLAYEAINWDEICTHKKSDHTEYVFGNQEVECDASMEVHSKISRITREIGYRNNANDWKQDDGTYTRDDSARMTVRALLPSSIHVSDLIPFNMSYDSFFDFIKEYKAVVYMRGSVNEEAIGHAWVCSGGERITTTTQGILIDGKDKVEVKTYFYFHWGWAGSCDGYFSAGVFDPSKSVTPSRANYSKDMYYFSVY